VIGAVLFWMWLGGAAGFALSALDSPEFRANLRRIQYMAEQARRAGAKWTWTAMLTIYTLGTVTALLWPLMILIRMTVGDWARQFLRRHFDFVEVRCAVCGLADEASVPKRSVSWTSIPSDWLINTQFEVVCSPRCAHHHDRCPGHAHEAGLH
jgi:hypothetical protein